MAAPPTNIIWILGHVLILGFGLFLTSIAAHSAHADILLGTGGSLVATGIAGEVLFLYIAFSQDTKERLDLIAVAGLQKIFATRSVSIRDEYHSRLRGAKEVDILGFGLASFREDYGSKFEELSLHTSFRILLLDPDFPSPDTSIASLRDIEEGNNPGDIKRDVEAFEAVVRRCANLDRSRFQVKRLRALPSVNVFRVDDELFWGPYLIATQSRNMPTLLVRKGGHLYEEMKSHFEQLWTNEQFSQAISE